MNIAVALPTQRCQVLIGVHLGVLTATHASRHYVMAVKSPVRATDFTRVRGIHIACFDIPEVYLSSSCLCPDYRMTLTFCQVAIVTS